MNIMDKSNGSVVFDKCNCYLNKIDNINSLSVIIDCAIKEHETTIMWSNNNTNKYDRLQSTSDQQKIDYQREWNDVERVFNDVIIKLLRSDTQNIGNVIDYRDPNQLANYLQLQITDAPIDIDQLTIILKKIVECSVKSNHRNFLNQLFHGYDPYGFVGAVVEEAINNTMATYEAMPVGQLIEQNVLDYFYRLIGWTDGMGMFCPGGSFCNMYGVNLARYSHNSQLKLLGNYQSKQLIIFATDMSHYSVTKAAAFMGLGSDSVIRVASDNCGRFQINALRLAIDKAIAHNQIPMMVWATSGTTVFNAYDPLDEIATICNEYRMWMHVDACFGGWALLTNTHRHLLHGIERADSLSWCWHKVIGAPFQTSVFLTRHKALMYDCHSCKAKYLFNPIKYYDTTFDSGDASLQCGRRADVLKVYVMMRARGCANIASLLDRTVESAMCFADAISNNAHFRFVIENGPKVQGTSVCFWLIPKSMRTHNNNADFMRKIGVISRELKRRMVFDGRAMIACQPVDEKQLADFFRVTFCCHPLNSTQDIYELVAILEQLVDSLE